MNQQESKSSWPGILVDDQGWLSAVIFARVRDRHAVDEILQETALAAIAGKRPTEPEGLKRWLYRVAIRQSVLYRRKQGRSEKKANGYCEIARRKSGDRLRQMDPVAVLMATEQVDQVRDAMRRLGNGDCEILLLKYSENWSCQQISERLGVSISAVKSRLLRARANLRAVLLQVNSSWEQK